MRYDAIVVGSGAGGGMAAYELTRLGHKVLLLEAGRNYDPIGESAMFAHPEDAPLNAARTPDKPFGYYDATVGGGWDIPGEPYTLKEGSEEFSWWRPRMLGGRTNHWGRIVPRFGPYDFKGKDRDGLGENWPVTYDEVADWYTKTEDLIGVTGEINNLENEPNSEPGVPHPVPKKRTHEYMLDKVFRSMGISPVGIRLAVLTRPHRGRDACFYATHCKRGCSIRAMFQSSTVLIPPAQDTGNLDIITDAMVYSVNTDENGMATGVSYVDRTTKERKTVTAKSVVLAAGACETARIMLNSNDGRGVANSSGMVGKYIMDTVGTAVEAFIPLLSKLGPRNDDGMSTAHIYVPWWGYDQQAKGELDFPRGYHIEVNGGCRMPDTNIGKHADFSDVKFGKGLRENMRRIYGSYIKLVGRGEMLPNDDCYLEIDPTVKDKWGIPVARFNWKWADEEIKQAEHMMKTFHEVVEKLGGTITAGKTTDGKKEIKAGGKIIHEVGGARMGDDPKTSVTNRWGQCWDTPNLYVMDGAIMPTNPHKNPTLSILTFSMRNSNHLSSALKKGEFA